MSGQHREGAGRRSSARSPITHPTSRSRSSTRPLLDPSDFKERCRDADFIISHAGMGTIITALTFQTPAVMMPRRAHLGEMRNDHQVATAEQFTGRGALHFAMEAEDLHEACDRLMAADRSAGGEDLSAFAAPSLIDALRAEIFR